MKFKDYIINPIGKKNSVFTNRDLFDKLYKDKLQSILVRENGRLDYFLYKNKDDYIIHFRIPSEEIDKFYYDIVIRFYTEDPIIKLKKSIEDYDIQVFSNDPHFAYTYINLFSRNNLIFKDMKSKIDKIFLKEKAKERNPDDLIGYVKTLYFSYLIMIRDSLFEKSKFDLYGKKYNKSELLKDIKPTDYTIKERKRLGEILKEKKKKQKRIESNKKERINNTTTNSSIRITPVVNKVSTVKSVKKI